MANPKISVREKGKTYELELLHEFGPVRGLVNFEGVYVLVDRKSIDDWELSGIPARTDEEKRVMKHYVDELESQGTVLKVTPPGEE